jgi:alpha-glucosidase
LTREGVCGLEHSKWTDQETPRAQRDDSVHQNGGRPVGLYTPGAMLNASEEHFSANFNRPMSLGTRCHQLAMYLIYESPLQMLADSPSNYRREPAVMDFLSPVPTVWDETIAIEAKVGDYVIMARRSGKEWYVGGMTDWEARAFDVSLGFLEKGKKYNAMIFQDGKKCPSLRR